MNDKPDKSNPSSPHQDHHIQEGWLDSQIGKPIRCTLVHDTVVGYLMDFDKFTLLMRPAMMIGSTAAMTDDNRPFLVFKQGVLTIVPLG